MKTMVHGIGVLLSRLLGFNIIFTSMLLLLLSGLYLYCLYSGINFTVVNKHLTFTNYKSAGIILLMASSVMTLLSFYLFRVEKNA